MNESPAPSDSNPTLSEPMEEVRAFLEKWKPFASLPPGNATRRSILRLLGTDVAEERGKILAMLGRVAEARQVIAEARTRWGDAPELMEVWLKLNRRR